MSGILSEMFDAQHAGSSEDVADALAPAVTEFLDSSLAEKIRAVLAFHDPNGLHPTDNASRVIMATITAVDDVDESYSSPGLRRYVANVKATLNMLVDNTPVTR